MEILVGQVLGMLPQEAGKCPSLDVFTNKRAIFFHLLPPYSMFLMLSNTQ